MRYVAYAISKYKTHHVQQHTATICNTLHYTATHTYKTHHAQHTYTIRTNRLYTHTYTRTYIHIHTHTQTHTHTQMWRQSRSFCRPCGSESKRARDRERERERKRESERERTSRATLDRKSRHTHKGEEGGGRVQLFCHLGSSIG
mmetsp:Transcript_16300/g.26129  ORF Transcript_16300/g.26129 Transcript_16300/m.26129 type:complete len:145 (+) Transcript_16300:634-1068(+)